MVESEHRKWLGLLVLGLGVALVVVDITVINVIIPSIIASLDLELADAEWINTIYSLALASLLISLGRLGDIWGPKRLFLAGLVVFGGASLAAGWASSGLSLVGARFVQGVGAAMILPATLSSVHATFQGRHRAIAFGIWGSVIAGMAAVGPLLGGWLATTWSWRWAFYINIPLAAITFAAAQRLVPHHRPQERSGFDLPGFAASSVALFALVLGLIEGVRYGWWRPTREFVVGSWLWPLDVLSPVPIALGVAVVATIFFVRIERLRAADGLSVLFDLSLFHYRSFRWGNVLALIVGLGEFGLVFVLPLYLRIVLQLSAFETGLLLLAMAGGGFVGGPGAALVAGRWGPRRAVTVGMGLEATGVLYAASLLAASSSAQEFILPLFVYGLGVGMASAQLASVILWDVPTEAAGQAAGMQSTFRQTGSALGIAILGSVFVTRLGLSTASGLAGIEGLGADTQAHIVEKVVDSAGWYVEALRYWHPAYAPVVDSVAEAIADAARSGAMTAFAFFLVGVVISLLLPVERARSAKVPEARD